MSDKEPTPTTLDGLIAEYLRAVDAGLAPERAAFLAAHPDHVAGLQSFFRDQDHLERVGADPDATLAPSTDTAGSPTMVRYFGDYELLEEIARGGMGVVYKARQASLNRLVALKMILTGQLASPQDVQRFHAEAEAAANLDHPNILPIYEVGVHEGQHYFSMKLVEGGNLAHSFATLRRSVSDRTLLRSVANQLVLIARAVHFAHQRDILHRDLKPANVLIDQDGTPYVTQGQRALCGLEANWVDWRFERLTGKSSSVATPFADARRTNCDQCSHRTGRNYLSLSRIGGSTLVDQPKASPRQRGGNCPHGRVGGVQRADEHRPMGQDQAVVSDRRSQPAQRRPPQGCLPARVVAFESDRVSDLLYQLADSLA